MPAAASPGQCRPVVDDGTLADDLVAFKVADSETCHPDPFRNSTYMGISWYFHYLTLVARLETGVDSCASGKMSMDNIIRLNNMVPHKRMACSKVQRDLTRSFLSGRAPFFHL